MAAAAPDPELADAMPLPPVATQLGVPALLGRAGRRAHVRPSGQQTLPGSQLGQSLSPRGETS